MPSHLGVPTLPPTEMPPPLFPPEIITQPSLIDQFGIMLVAVTILVAGIVVFIVIRRTRKKCSNAFNDY